MDFKDKDTKRKLISGGITVAVHGIVVVFLLLMGLRYPDPPPPEQGVEMDLGMFSDVGLDTEHAAEGGEDVSSENSVSDDDNSAVTQDAEDVPLVSKKTKPNPDKKKKQAPTETKESNEPKIDQNALFSKGKVKKGSGGSAGVGEGTGSGSGGDGGGSGTSFSLAGRGAKELGKPSSTASKVGNVVVEIKVDQEGNVIAAKAGVRGTTLWDTNMFRLCEQAARKSQFTANPDAPEVQKGTITYIFR